MSVIPKQFQVEQNAVVTYDFQDLADGTGYVLLYGAFTGDSSGFNGILTRNAIASDKIVTADQAEALEATISADIDFDLEINQPIVVNGRVIVNVPCSPANGSCSTAGNIKLIIRFRKYDGTTETTIASVTTKTITLSGASCNQYTHDKNLTAEIDVPRTSFKRGDILRVTVEVYSWAVGNWIIAHDPLNREPDQTENIPDGSTTTAFLTGVDKRMRVFLPLEIE